MRKNGKKNGFFPHNDGKKKELITKKILRPLLSKKIQES